jgi:outer membrane protein OmpA-like peptidoglycan-associated protein
MSKKLLYLLGILLTIIVGTILHWYYSCDYGVKSGNKGTAKTDNTIVAVPEEKFVVVEETPSDSTGANKLLELRLKLQANPLVLYYEINQSEITLSQEEKQKLEEITDYLKNVPDTELTITGHSDNTGSRDDNIKLGQKRADRVKAYLGQNGISGNKITCTSKGHDEPVADNNTPEGRAKNRRTVIQFK